MNDFGGSRGAFRNELAMWCVHTAKAWEMLHDPKVTEKLNTEAYMGLCRAAGYGEDAVQKAGNSWANKRLDCGLDV